MVIRRISIICLCFFIISQAITFSGTKTLFEAGKNEETGFDLLIIGARSFEEGLARYRLFKVQNGLRTRVSYIEDIFNTIEGKNNAYKIRNYIIKAYRKEQISFVLLVGGPDLIPAVVFQKSAEAVRDAVASDQFYSNLDKEFDSNNDGIYAGNRDDVDFYPNVLLGRWPVSNAEDVETVINRTINYLSGPLSYREDYYSRLLLFAFDLFQKGDSEILCNRVALSAGPGLVPDRMYINSTPGMDRQMALFKLNEGANIVYVQAHAVEERFGVRRGWGIYSEDIFDTRTPSGLYFIATCKNGDFSNNAMVIEAMRSPLGGCVNYIGPSNLEYPTITGRMHNIFFSQLAAGNRIGTALNHARINGFPNLSPATDSRQLYFGYNLHGDPSNYVFMQIPVNNYITEFSALRKGTGSISATLKHQPKHPVTVTITANDRLIAKKVTDNKQFTIHYENLKAETAIIAISSHDTFFNKLTASVHP